MRIVRCLTTLTLSATLTAGVSATVTVPALLSPTPARAETEQAQALNKRTLDAFVASIPAVRAWTEQHEKAARTAAPKVLNPSALLGNPFGLLVKELEGTDAYAAMDIAVSRHGFDTPEAWADVANRVTKALGVLAARTDAADNALTQALAEIETNPDISAEDRVKLKGLLMAVSLFANAPQSDVAAVEPYSQQIIRALRQPL